MTSKDKEVIEALVKIVQLNKLSIEQLLNFGVKNNFCDVWIAIFKTEVMKKSSFKQLLEFGKKVQSLVKPDPDIDGVFGYSKVWETMIVTMKFSSENLLEIGKTANLFPVWQRIVPLLNLEEYSPEQLLDFGRKSNPFGNWVWLKIVQSNKLSIEQLLEVRKESESVEVLKEIEKSMAKL